MKAAAPEEVAAPAELVAEAAESESDSDSDDSELESELVAVGLPVETVAFPPLVAVAKPLLPVPIGTTAVLTTGTTTVLLPAGVVSTVGCEVTTVGCEVITDGWPVTTPSESV